MLKKKRKGNDLMRFISIAARPMPSGPCGGSGGVSYRLMKANEKYRMFEDTVFIFTDRCISSSEGEVNVDSTPKEQQIIELEEYYAQLDDILHFNDGDFFVFHNIEAFCAMKDRFTWIEKSLVVYHQQGSMYSEYLFMGNKPDEVYEKACFYLTSFAVEKSGVFGFPSVGAKQAMIDTLPEIGPYLEKKKEAILYNGCSPVLPTDESAVDGLIEILDQVRGYIFITVATLNEAKGVERLPAFFREYGKLVEDYFWIVIGNGAKREELSKGLEDLEGHVIWLDGWVDNRDIIRLYNRADFYILSHRFSIFDYATIEAMHMGCIPILTPVGGNLEMIIEDNGYFLDDTLSGKGFAAWCMDQDIEELKERNRRIAQERFSEYSMLKAYYDVANDQ